jgi:hypothetical protein
MRADYRAGQLMALVYNVHRDRDKDPKGATWQDFFPQDEPEEQTDEQMLEAMMLWAHTTSRAA